MKGRDTGERGAGQWRLRVAAAAAALALVGGCAGGQPLPLCVQDTRADGAAETPVDVYAVENERELRRATVTPVDEYFSTLGRPTRPVAVWRSAVAPAAEPAELRPGEYPYTRWLQSGAVRLIAQTPQPPRVSTEMADPRRVVFSLWRGDYPRGTRSLLLSVTEGGLTVMPSAQEIKEPKSVTP